MKVNIRQILVTMLIVIAIFLGMHFSLQSYVVDGKSMEPSFIDGEWLLVDKLSYHFGSPERGDVVILHPPVDSSGPFIKRIIGVPGDHINITEEGDIYINNHLLEENPDNGPTDRIGSYCNVDVGEDEYFVLGDNRSSNHGPVGNSYDSRSFGLVPEKNIIGKVWIRYWPPSEWGLSPSYSATIE